MNKLSKREYNISNGTCQTGVTLPCGTQGGSREYQIINYNKLIVLDSKILIFTRI